ncbi:MAG: radical SAM protein [Nitrospirae bacterium]|nr:radical SAM protein [Nitrospirota bacterium]
MSDFKPFLIAWNLTKRCNLRCTHCYLSAGERDAGSADELTTEECFRVIDGMARVNPAAILVLTGGEPLLRKDLSKISQYAAGKGMMVVVGTNGTLLTDAKIRELQNTGVMGVSISVDSLNPGRHDAFRMLPGSLEGALCGIDACRRNELPFQIHTTAGRMNYEEIPFLIEFAYNKGARVFNLFFLVCTGRGEAMSDITPEQYEQILGHLVDAQQNYPGMFIRSRCAPHFKRIAYEKNPDSPITKAQGYEAGGCLAGAHYARITPDGDLTPCPFMPISVGNLRTEGFDRLWDASPVFDDLRRPALKGKCGDCEYADLCGGCRARPFASHGDYMDEDIWCLYTPKGGPKIVSMKEEVIHMIWSQEAGERLSRLPFFLQKMIKGRVERRAQEEGLEVITLEFMEALRKKTFGDAAPVFKDGRFQGLSGQ